MSKRKSLFVCYVRLNTEHESCDRPVFCYAFSYCHSMNLAIRFCVDCLHWELNSFVVSKPVLITNFTH